MDNSTRTQRSGTTSRRKTSNSSNN